MYIIFVNVAINANCFSSFCFKVKQQLLSIDDLFNHTLRLLVNFSLKYKVVLMVFLYKYKIEIKNLILYPSSDKNFL